MRLSLQSSVGYRPISPGDRGLYKPLGTAHARFASLQNKNEVEQLVRSKNKIALFDEFTQIVRKTLSPEKLSWRHNGGTFDANLQEDALLIRLFSNGEEQPTGYLVFDSRNSYALIPEKSTFKGLSLSKVLQHSDPKDSQNLLDGFYELIQPFVVKMIWEDFAKQEQLKPKPAAPPKAPEANLVPVKPKFQTRRIWDEFSRHLTGPIRLKIDNVPLMSGSRNPLAMQYQAEREGELIRISYCRDLPNVAITTVVFNPGKNFKFEEKCSSINGQPYTQAVKFRDRKDHLDQVLCYIEPFLRRVIESPQKLVWVDAGLSIAQNTETLKKTLAQPQYTQPQELWSQFTQLLAANSSLEMNLKEDTQNGKTVCKRYHASLERDYIHITYNNVEKGAPVTHLTFDKARNFAIVPEQCLISGYPFSGFTDSVQQELLHSLTTEVEPFIQDALAFQRLKKDASSPPKAE